MDVSPRQIFYREAEFDTAWRRPTGSRWGKRVGNPDDAVWAAANFLAGALLRDGFRLFKNGGSPLLERRTLRLVEEIVLKPAPDARRRGHPAVAVQLHLSHTGLRGVRERYWRPSSRAPQVVASGDLGQLDIPPGWVLWNLTPRQETLEEMVEWVERLALPWFETFHRPTTLRRALDERMVPLVSLETSLELMLTEFGQVEAALFLERHLTPETELREAVRNEVRRIIAAQTPMGFGDDTAHNLAVIAACFRLMPKA